MPRNYTLFETDTLPLEAKAHIGDLCDRHGNAPVILYALHAWADEIESTPKDERGLVRLRDWQRKITRAVEELEAAIKS